LTGFEERRQIDSPWSCCFRIRKWSYFHFIILYCDV